MVFSRNCVSDCYNDYEEWACTVIPKEPSETRESINIVMPQSIIEACNYSKADKYYD